MTTSTEIEGVLPLTPLQQGLYFHLQCGRAGVDEPLVATSDGVAPDRRSSRPRLAPMMQSMHMQTFGEASGSVGFADDPIAPHSAQFPLGRAGGAAQPSLPSGPERRPWGLGGMRPVRSPGDPVRALFHYDHATQTAIDACGRTLVAADPSAEKVSDNDGDEGASEDYKHDFCPDQPFQI